MNKTLLSKIADRIDRTADRLRFTGKIADAEACSQAASRIRAGMSIDEAQAIEAYFIFGISSGIRTRLSAMSGSGEYDGSSAPAGQPGQASMGMETISQNMQYAAALSQDSYVEPYIGVQYPTNPLLTDPLKGGPSPYYPGGQSVNSYNAQSPAASPSGQTPNLYSESQNFNAYAAPSTGFDSSLSPFFPRGGGTLDTSQLLASNGPITPRASADTPYTTGAVGKTLQGTVTRNGNSYARYLVTINGVPQYNEYVNDMLRADWTEPLQSTPAPDAVQPEQPIPAAYDSWANESWLSRQILSGSGGYLQNDQNLANLQQSIGDLTLYVELGLMSGGVGNAISGSALLNATSLQAFKAALIPIGVFVFQQIYAFNNFAPLEMSAPLGGTVAPPGPAWSINLLPVRSTAVGLPRIWMEDHAFNPATDAEGSGTAVAFFGSGFDPLGGAAFRGRSSSGTRCDSSVLLKAAKSRSFEKRYSRPLLMTSSGDALMKAAY